MAERLARSFFARSSPVVARELIGMVLVRALPDGTRVAGRIVEAEAYLSRNDPAAHSARGPTVATRALYEQAGTLYLHPMRRFWGMDIVCGQVGMPESVLLRAMEPLESVETMRVLRGVHAEGRLSDGPGKLCAALGIGRDMYGQDVCAGDSPVYLTNDGFTGEVACGPRVGITQARELPLRFWLAGSAFVSGRR